MRTIVIVGVLLVTGSFSSYAQYSFYNKPRFEKWIYAGGGHFFGDIGGKQTNGITIAGNEGFDLTNLGLAAGTGIRFNAKRWFAVRTGLGYSRFSQSDAGAFRRSQQLRNLSFQTDVFEASAMAEFRVANFGIKTKKRKSFWEYYVFGGVGAFYYNPKAHYGDKLVALRPLTTEGQGLKPGTKKYSVVAGSFPVGGGLRLGTGFNSSFFVEVSYHITTTDYIDDVSGSYYSYNELLFRRGEVSADMSYRGDSEIYPQGRTRGNPYNKDSFVVFKLGYSTSLKSRKLTRFHGR
ncbi:MAG: hypothetical protein JJ975_01955 [Bacteroidia bacterium]|nr:hypothetical protein [Bacteroidia bacterium]